MINFESPVIEWYFNFAHIFYTLIDKILKLFKHLVFIFNFSVENLEHCDFIALRNMLIRTHLQDLKDVTNNVHYENFRCISLAGHGPDGKPTRISNK